MSWYDWFKASTSVASVSYCGTCGNPNSPGMGCGYCAAKQQIGVQSPSWIYNTLTTTSYPGTFTATQPSVPSISCPLCADKHNMFLVSHILNHKRLKAQITLSIMSGDSDLAAWQGLLGVIGLENIMGVEEPSQEKKDEPRVCADRQAE